MNFYDFRARDESRVDERTEQLAERVIGAAIEVHKQLGPGLPETSYRKALCREFDLRGIPYAAEVPFPIMYKGEEVGRGQIDILVDSVLIIELKAVESLSPIHRAQVVTYLQITKLKLALLINFNVTILKDGTKRVINTY